jgi:hypothetical protein
MCNQDGLNYELVFSHSHVMLVTHAEGQTNLFSCFLLYMYVNILT